MLIGNITFSAFRGNAAVSLKLGLGDALATPMVLSAPHIAYIQTSSGTTAGSIHDSAEPESGYRMFVHRIDDSVANVLKDMIDAQKVTLGFNRKKDGIDVLFPLDLLVESVSFEASKPKRKRSTKALDGFVECFSDVAKQVR